MKAVKALSCVIVLVAIMAACGGGGCNPCEPEPVPKVNCATKPEACR